MSCSSAVSEVAEFTVTGDNESVTCALNAVFNGSIVSQNEAAFQLELCKGKSIAKIYTSDNPANNLPGTVETRNLLQASEVCYSQETVIQALLSPALVRSLLYGNVDIRSLLTCGDAVYVQVPPEYLQFAINILSNCDNPSAVSCYKSVPMNCACSPSGIEVRDRNTGITVIPPNSAASQTVSTTVIVTKLNSSIYIGLQLVSNTFISLVSTPIVTIVNNSRTITISTPDKMAFCPSSTIKLDIAYTYVYHADQVNTGQNTITATMFVETPSTTLFIIEAAEIQNVATPSIDPGSIGTGIGSSSGATPSSMPADSFTFSATSQPGKIGFMSVADDVINTTASIVTITGNSPTILIPPAVTGQIDTDTGLGAILAAPTGTPIVGNTFTMSSTVESDGVPTNGNWAAAAVGILPAGPPATCPITNCHFPVPDCNFQYPCKLVNCCNKKK